MNKKWVRFERDGETAFGELNGEHIAYLDHPPWDDGAPTGETCPTTDVKLLAPCTPSKMIALWNNFHALAEKQGHAVPDKPLYFMKPASCVIGPGDPIESPASYNGRVFYEGELAIVIGTRCKNVTEAEVDEAVLGYTCINDVTAFPIITETAAFPQWTRAKSFDTFGPLGPCIAQVDDPDTLIVKTLVQGRERQHYPIADAIFSPRELVRAISADMTLEPGDVIACGTSLGALPMKAGATVEVVIEGIGTLSNAYIGHKGQK